MPDSRLFRSRLLFALLLTGVVTGTSACRNTASENTPASDEARPAVSAQVAAMSSENLRQSATQAVKEQRLYAPSGNNAMEYYLALRDKLPEDTTIAGALADLQPYALIAAEQAVLRQDFVEAKRLYALLEKTDARAPALPRLQASIQSAETHYQMQRSNEETRLAEQERKRQEEAARQQQMLDEQNAQIVARRQAEAAAMQEVRVRESPARQEPESRPLQASAPAPIPQPETVRDEPAEELPKPALPPAATQAPIHLQAISTPAPRYPAEALRNGVSGSVQVEFTVDENGRVRNARIVQANPTRIFNNDTLSAVRRWRFEPPGRTITSRRTIHFTPEQQ